MFPKEIRNIFYASGTAFVSATNVARVGKQGNICVHNIVSSFATTFRVAREEIKKMPSLCLRSRPIGH